MGFSALVFLRSVFTAAYRRMLGHSGQRGSRPGSIRSDWLKATSNRTTLTGVRVDAAQYLRALARIICKSNWSWCSDP